MEYASKRSSGRMGEVAPATLDSGALQALDHKRSLRYRRGNEQFKHQYLFTRCGDDQALRLALERRAVCGGTANSPVERDSAEPAEGA
jgi:hypothetical protein